MRIDAILPAGGRISGEFASSAKASIKALIEYEGRTLLERVLSSVRGAGLGGSIAVIGPGSITTHPASFAADVVLPEGDSGPANIRKGMEWLKANGGEVPAERILIVTTDLPFITKEAIADFVRKCPEDADLCVPIYSRAEFVTAYPGCEAHFVRLRSGEWTTGCAFLVKPGAIENNWGHIEQVFAARKSQFAMARLLGAMVITRLVTRRLDVHHVERRCRQILGCSGAAVRGCDPVLAFDIDEERDYRYTMELDIKRVSGVGSGAA